MAETMKNQPAPSFRNLYAFGEKLPIDLSLSENPLGCSPNVAIALAELKEEELFDYPDPNCNQLRQAIATQSQIDSGTIFVSNGSSKPRQISINGKKRDQKKENRKEK